MDNTPVFPSAQPATAELDVKRQPLTLSLPSVSEPWRYALAYGRLALGSLIGPHRLRPQGLRAYHAPVHITPRLANRWRALFDVPSRATATVPLLANQSVGTLLHSQLFADLGINLRHLMHLHHRTVHHASVADCATARQQQLRCRVQRLRRVGEDRVLVDVQTQVLAPDSGVISARSATVGSVVGAGTELFRLIAKSRLEWRAEVTSAEVARIKPGTAVTVTAASGTPVQGRVRMVAPTVDPLTRNALVYVDLPRNAGVKAGMYAQGEFALGSINALTLPQQALVLRDGFSYAMRINEASKVQQVKLQTGRRVGDSVEILQGAKAGERFVGSGAAFLADGDTVRVVTAAGTASAAKQP